LLGNPAVDHDDMLAGHRQATITRASRRAHVVQIEDGTALSFPRGRGMSGLGPVDTGMLHPGVLVHTSLLVDGETGETLGISHQDVWSRPWTKAPARETAEQRKQRPRQSEAWARGSKALAAAIKAESPEGGPRVTFVADREADVYEALIRVMDAGHGFVIRAVRDRKLADPVAEKVYSLAAGLAGPILGTHAVVIPRRSSAEVRTATLTLRAVSVNVLPPKNNSRKGKAIPMTVVVAREEGDVQGPRLEWMRMTDVDVSDLASAIRVVEIYKLRWRIEEFHKGLKTGCGCEDVQFDDVENTKKFLALASVVTWHVLALRDAARCEEKPVSPGIISPVALKILAMHDKKLPRRPNTRDVTRAVARLGGFLSRTRDGEPGWQTIWSGFRRLMEWEFAFHLLKGTSG